MKARFCHANLYSHSSKLTLHSYSPRLLSWQLLQAPVLPPLQRTCTLVSDLTAGPQCQLASFSRGSNASTLIYKENQTSFVMSPLKVPQHDVPQLHSDPRSQKIKGSCCVSSTELTRCFTYVTVLVLIVTLRDGCAVLILQMRKISKNQLAVELVSGWIQTGFKPL